MIPRTSSSRWLAGAAVIVTLLVAFSGIIAVVNSEREPAPLATGSPGRAVQDYILALQREDAHAAYALLSEEARERCDPNVLLDGRFSLPRNSFSVRLLRTEEQDGEATVTIEITEVHTPGEFPLLGGSVSTREATYRLIREEGEWRLRERGFPGWSCPRKSTPTPLAPVVAKEP